MGALASEGETPVPRLQVETFPPAPHDPRERESLIALGAWEARLFEVYPIANWKRRASTYEELRRLVEVTHGTQLAWMRCAS